MINGGDITEVALSNANVGTMILIPVGGEASTYEIGGVENDDDPAVDASGRLMTTKTRKAGKLTAVIGDDMNSRQEYEFCKAIGADLTDTTITFSHINGTVYVGKGTAKPSELDGQKSSFTITCYSGAGFVQQ